MKKRLTKDEKAVTKVLAELRAKLREMRIQLLELKEQEHVCPTCGRVIRPSRWSDGC